MKHYAMKIYEGVYVWTQVIFTLGLAEGVRLRSHSTHEERVTGTLSIGAWMWPQIQCGQHGQEEILDPNRPYCHHFVIQLVASLYTDYPTAKMKVYYNVGEAITASECCLICKGEPLEMAWRRDSIASDPRVYVTELLYSTKHSLLLILCLVGESKF
jgi:hypothetical protein